MGIDYYGVLSLKRNCNNHEIKRATVIILGNTLKYSRFRRLILQYNPERQRDASVYEIFSTVAEAYDVLSDPFRRAVYDQFGEEGLKRGMPGSEDFIHPYVYHGDPMRTYREFFGTENPYVDVIEGLSKPLPMYDVPEGKGVRRKEPPLVRPLLLTLHEIYYGGVKKLKINRLELSGDRITTVMKEKILDVPIDPGLPTGTKITFPEEGDQGPTIIPADIVFVTEDRPHERFTRAGDDLIMFCNISLRDALVGMVVLVETLDGRSFRVNITEIVSPEYQKIVPGEGMPIMENPKKKGNLIIKFNIDFPKYFPKASKDLIARAWQVAQAGGKPGDPDHVVKMVMLDKMNRISKQGNEFGNMNLRRK